MARKPKYDQNPTPNDHLEWGNYHWKKLQDRLNEWEASLVDFNPDTHALMRAYRHAYGAELNYLNAEGADTSKDIAGGNTISEAYENAKEYRHAMTASIGKMLESMAWNRGIKTYIRTMGDLIGDTLEREITKGY